MSSGEGGAADDDALQAVRGTDSDRARRRLAGIPGAGQPLLVDRSLARRSTIAINRNDARGAVGIAVDGDDELGGGGITITVGQRIGVPIRQALSGLQRIDRRVGVVQRVDVTAVVVQQQRTIRQVNGSGGSRYRRGVGICTHGVISENRAADGIRKVIFGDHIAVHNGKRHTVDDLNSQCTGSRTLRPGDAQRNAIDTFAGARLVLSGIKGVGVGKRSACGVEAGQRQGADASDDRLRCRGKCA